MHLKNFSLITRQRKVELAPAYDYVSTTVALLALGKTIETIEEIALPLQGKKRRLNRNIWIDYFAQERLQLPDKMVRTVEVGLARTATAWRAHVACSLLPPDQKEHYRRFLDERFGALRL